MKSVNIRAFERLGYTNVNIGFSDIPRQDENGYISNVTADQDVNVTFSSFMEAVRIEQAWDDIRVKRNKLLVETDWAAGVDVPSNIKDALIPYRNSLRNITVDYDNPEDVVFPEFPEF